MDKPPGARRVLVAVDESEASARVGDFVNRFFGGLDIEIIAITVGPVALEALPPTTLPSLELGGALVAPSFVASEETTASRLQAGDDIIDRSPLQEDERVVDQGDPIEAIERAANELEVDLIVVGMKHKSLLDRFLSGSVAASLARSSPRPVLIVH